MTVKPIARWLLLLAYVAGMINGMDSDVMATIVHDVTLGIPPENSALAPMTPEQLEWRDKVTPEIDEIKAAGGIVDLGSFAD